ncbi:hypothetical protein ALP75_204956 [Pseudomonas syringae pv. actinidiae]|nr:hypothetical protein ALP75_204956 [Pseudomonas syringae pv. actinidiae]
MQVLAEHLQTAADAHQLAAVAQVPVDGRVPAVGAQVVQVAAHAFRAGQDNQVGRRNALAWADELQVDLRVQAQRVEIGVITDARQHRHDHIQHLLDLVGLALIEAVFGLQVQVHHIGQHADHRFAGARFKPVKPRLQQGDVTAKTVDDETFDPRLFAGRQQLQRADQMSKHAATIDVGNQQHRAVHGLGKAHVGDVIGAQVDFSRRPRAFDHDHRVAFAQPTMRLQHRLHGDLFIAVISHRVHGGDGAAMNNDLCAGVAVGLEQHRVHVGVRRQEARLGLHGLRPTDLAAVRRHRAVERHVLRLERHDFYALAGQPAAQCRHQGTFTGVGGGALYHQRGHGYSLRYSSRTLCRRCQSASSRGRPKRRLPDSGVSPTNRRNRTPRCAQNA